MGREISDLKHTRINLEDGAKVIILDTGAVIDPESNAMIQALNSRDPRGFDHHIGILAKKGPEKFMKTYYVGYNHKSIGDCGTTTIFIENVSMLTAKAIQDTPLYSGQEASTRYIDFSNQPFIDPTNSDEGREMLEMQRGFYMWAQEPTRATLRQMHPIKEGENPVVHAKAINARTFDITRSLLPAGASTNLSWHTNLRQAADRLLFLRHHPLAKVRGLAIGLEEGLKTCYPDSFSHKRYPETDAYQDLIAKSYYFHDPNSPAEPIVDFSNINRGELERYNHFFVDRPLKTELPKFLSQIGTIDVRYTLDFGSFRDIQRQRSVIQRMPLLTRELEFNQWYVDNFPQEVRERLPDHLGKVERKVIGLSISREDEQYFNLMGYNTSNRFTGDLPAGVYIVDLRASKMVHPTLQKVAYSIGNQLTNFGVKVYMDSEPGRFDIKRGEQDIVERK